MFNYKEFKKEMEERGHKVRKNGFYITIEPNNNYIDYGEGFLYFSDIVEGFEDDLKLVSASHFNTWIYWARFKIIED